ncbi:DUF3347 domain-containing protein [Flagellimonas nanhaiensis]|uniref:DUF3347 domain-containing protein n=1 Tax=Flagellimonas nanhaiensis TaxID=2292706 RepID=A0A371JN00_9FLAO|nr:DUF3347 domain-containing protein [Allomuricauda nanhaiensis]RDY58607.1 DUF3347 domain-containing protein [Allomuricauda nanhaiensis]
MTLIKSTVIWLVALATMVCSAQLKNQKTLSAKIHGNCEKCESTIENAGDIKDQSDVDWNKETKMAMISFDSLKTSIDEILKRIALAGYNNDIFLAPTDTYSRLPGCCQYKGAVKARGKSAGFNMDSETLDHVYSNQKMVRQETHLLSTVFDNYFVLKDALVNSDGITASASAKSLLRTIKDVQMEKLPTDVHMVWMKVLKPLEQDIGHIAATENINRQRVHFASLSRNIYEVLKISKPEVPVYYQYCPMASDGKGANWLSKEEIVKNPYYGSVMLSCGQTVETIKQ